GTLDEPPAEVSAASAVGDLYTLHGDYRRAIQSYEAAAERATPAGIGEIQHKLAQVHHRRGDWANAERHYAAARKASTTFGEQARILADWSLAVHRAGDRALAECEELGDRHRTAALHNNLADILRAQGRKEDSMRHLKRAVRLFSEIGEAGTTEPEVWKLVAW